MSTGLRHVRDRYEATPRGLDGDDMDRLKRGDRGCLGDLLAGAGAITLVILLVLSGMGRVGFAWVYVGVALFVGGFAVGAVSQARSGRERQAALESGPLVFGVVLRSAPWLRRPGKRPGRAVVLLCTDPQRRFDREWLERTAASLEARLANPESGADSVPLRALLADEDLFASHAVPKALLAEPPSAGEVYLSAMIVHPERLEGGYLGAEDDREADARDEALDAPTRPPVIAAIVAPERGFIEQAPHVAAP
ncbi:hypothetical protein G6O69_20305 [Pseudenhygromyxa sp. WMMC2535]|uniref:hypothetical protein n=1 Tax=Pseudenhygromyxa sp. WMMC2535 TaxID=2712867 RepID=UPI0015548FF4|nr:hypothetical protein [Pseudenhygromyxa sp. WMMC2535]NVB40201.1 hypothetical protein [Pseudenhygromyxa sp. WMMC2535]